MHHCQDGRFPSKRLKSFCSNAVARNSITQNQSVCFERYFWSVWYVLLVRL